MSGISSQAFVRVYAVQGSAGVTAIVGVDGMASSGAETSVSATEAAAAAAAATGSGSGSGGGGARGNTRVGFAWRASQGKIGGGRASGWGFVSGT
jgi:hypothetical protein